MKTPETKKSHINKDNPPAYPAGTKWDIEIPDITLNEMVDQAIAEYGDKSALDFLGKKLSFNELDELINKAAKGFQDMGVKKGDRVGVFMPNSTYHFIMFFGALKAGATLVPFLSTYNEEQLEQQIKDSDTKIMVTMDLDSNGNAFYPKVENLVKKCKVGDDFKIINCKMQDILPFPKNYLYRAFKSKQITKVDKKDPKVAASTINYSDFMKNKGDFKPVEVKADDLALLQYTNGTSSGKPKGVQLTHGNITANVLQTEEYMVAKDGQDARKMVARGEEKILGILPYFHVYGMNVLMMFSMRAGAEVLILPNPRDLKQIASTVKKEKPSLAPFVPKHYMAFVEKMSKKDLKPFSDIKIFMSGSEKLKNSVRKAFEDAVGCTILEGYGASEGAPVFSAQTLAKPSAPGNVGYVLPGNEVKIIPEAPADEKPKNWDPVDLGVKGEICVKGKNITKGYWNRPEATELALKDEWYRTGDLGTLDEEGRLTIQGRSKDIIIINGENVACAAVEDHILKLDNIAECQAVDVDDPRSGEAAVAFIRFKPGKTPKDASEVLKKLKDLGTPSLETPKHIVFWPEDKELPTVGVGKPDKNALRKIAADKFAPKKKGPDQSYDGPALMH